jgi:OOP family OmpA-OmpF porin
MIATRTLIFAGVAAAQRSLRRGTIFLPGMSFAQDTRNQGYLVDTNGNIVTSATTGLCWRCWRDSDWTPARSVEPCDLVKKAGAPAPKLAAVTPPQPAPQPAPAPVKMLPQKINFSADALFDFDKAVLKPEGKAMLDELTRVLQGAKYEVILATGHTDRFGTAEYNQKLSIRRANAVKDYLTSKEIPPNRISVDGKGKTQPVTKYRRLPGRKERQGHSVPAA